MIRNKNMHISLISLAGLLCGVLFQTSLVAATLDGNEVPMHLVKSETCKECHKKIYKQWKGSMHAQSTALKDPIHGAFYRQVVGDPTKEGVKHKASGKYPVCLQCHSPNAALDKTTKLDALPAYSEGVNCVACHTLKNYKGINGADGKMKLGAKAWDHSDALQGPNGFLHEQGAKADKVRFIADDEGELNPHLGRDNSGKPYMSEEDMKEINLPLEGNSAMKTSQACLGCHDKRNNPKGVSLCQTGDEYLEGKSRETCQSCHMPMSEGIADHSMGGGHNIAMLRRAVRFEVQTEKQGDQLAVNVELENLQPHNVPTGAPFRNIYVKVTALSKEGEVLWKNFQKHPAKEDPKAFFVYTMTDDAGHPAPPPKASAVGKNTRLKPYETRVLGYQMPAKGVDSVRAELYYNLLWPGLVKKFKMLPEDLKAPKLIAWSESKL
ncbi:hypothetical protein DJ030_09680 [bacterium endosymbiont of Escarpia laminata]|nr:MAG: hypothetical protein DJ030_09680 [bacterium endosymbiont of Escarpia laminata]